MTKQIKKFITRDRLLKRIKSRIQEYPVTLILGPRQCGKTTIAKQICELENGTYFDLEDPETPLQPDIAKLVLQDIKGLVVIDEFQRQPGLFSLLRVLSDRRPLQAKFLVLGSASLKLVKGVSESLAGRVAYIEMSGFNLSEISENDGMSLWGRGSFPLAFLANDTEKSIDWRNNFIQLLLERDMPQLGIRIPAITLRRFWMMAAHFHGQIWNAAEFARSLGTKEDTARRYLDILSDAYMIRQLPPWFENIGKRLVKSPKVYIRDSGILHAFLGMKSLVQLQSHSKLGLSWEGFALEQLIQLIGDDRQVYFYKTHGGAELDTLVISDNQKFGFEFKYQDAPRMTKSLHQVQSDLDLNKTWLIYPGERNYPLSDHVEVISINRLAELLLSEGMMCDV